MWQGVTRLMYKMLFNCNSGPLPDEASPMASADIHETYLV